MSVRGPAWVWLAAVLALLAGAAHAVTVEFNNTGGSTSTNGLHFYIEDTTKIQVRRLNNTGQVYNSTAIPPSTSLDNGVFIRANGLVYGPDHNVNAFNPSGGMYNTYSIGAVSPANPSSPGVQQTVTGSFGITSGPQATVVWKYTTPLDFLTAEVTLTIPSGYAVSAANPVRYYHVFDTYLGGTDNGCGVSFVDANAKRMIGTYPPVSGTTCPSSTSIPAGVSVVESFRERSGLNFSAYCAAGWASFFVNGSPNCSILQSAAMSNTVTTSYQDTGIGIEYDFTAPGTYTFSYDFVVGSPLVPPYDHLEIQHDGSATLCPENVTVLACTSSTVPCPVANLVNTGTLTGNLTVTPSTPTVTITPATFTLGTTATTATVTLQGSAPGGTYSLGTSNPSSVPLNGTKCWNTATSSQSCTLVISNASCVSRFNACHDYATSQCKAAGRLYTRLAGSTFGADVVALDSAGNVTTGFAGKAVVSLIARATPGGVDTQNCFTPDYSQTLDNAVTAFASGRLTLNNASSTNAYREARIKVVCDSTNCPPSGITACSADNFAIRPQAFTVSSTSANADATGASATLTPTIKAGAAFGLTATAVAGYNGTPLLNTAQLAAHAGAAQTGTLGGAFGTANSATGAAAAAAATPFTYSEVGYFRFNVGLDATTGVQVAAGVYDDTFTSVDGTSDCTSDFSNTAVGGKFGCKFGNTSATSYFGRFIPDHFDTVVIPASGAGGFTYSGQPFPLKVTAANSAGGTTKNYKYVALGSGSFAKAATLSDVDGAAGTFNPATVAASAFSAGVADLISPASVAFAFTSKPAAPATIKVRAVDDEASSATGAEGTTPIRAGRLRLINTYGSELLPSRVEYRAEYWDGNRWTTNTLDSATSIAAANIATGGLTVSGVTSLTAGIGFITFATAAAGSYDIAVNLNASGNDTSCNAAHPAGTTAANKPWLQGYWSGSCGGTAAWAQDPSARVRLGSSKSPLIYRREQY